MKKPCVIGEYCKDHGFIHGAEAEELRQRIEKLCVEFKDDEPHHIVNAMKDMLDDVDARDSLAFREKVGR